MYIWNVCRFTATKFRLWLISYNSLVASGTEESVRKHFHFGEASILQDFVIIVFIYAYVKNMSAVCSTLEIVIRQNISHNDGQRRSSRARPLKIAVVTTQSYSRLWLNEYQLIHSISVLKTSHIRLSPTFFLPLRAVPSCFGFVHTKDSANSKICT